MTYYLRKNYMHVHCSACFSQRHHSALNIAMLDLVKWKILHEDQRKSNENFTVWCNRSLWYKYKEKMLSIFNKLFHRGFVLPLVIFSPVTCVLHILGNDYYKVKSLMPFSISYFELLNVSYCFIKLWSKCVVYLSKNQHCLNNFWTTLVSGIKTGFSRI